MKKMLLFALLLTGLSFAATAQTPSTDTAVLKQYLGKYKFPEGSPVTDVTVAIENGVLTMASAVGNSVLEKQGEDIYAIVQFQGTATFKRNEEKKVIGVNIFAMGYTLEGTREETTVLQKKP
ncbi:MAG TPA: hypothetical protein VJ552_01790 [Sediminibacterium sp.]|nr:hypothetical protein [Sediminibacterium sp.]